MANELERVALPAEPKEVTLLDIRRDKVRYPRLYTYPEAVAISRLESLVTKLFMYKGHTIDKKNIAFIASNLYAELMANEAGAKYITIEEAERVLKTAILESDMVAISVVSLYRELIKYFKGKGNELREQIKREEQERQLRQSVMNPMLAAYAGAMVKTNKV